MDVICEGLTTNWSELRGWIQLAIVATAASFAILTYRRSGRQNRLQNAIKLVERFEKRFEGHDYDQYRKLVEAAYEGAGVSPGQFLDSEGHKASFADLFSEGSLDGGASMRIMQELDIICGEWLKDTISKEYVYNNLGGLMQFYHMHLTSANLLPDEYSWKSFSKVMQDADQYMKQWSYRQLALSEDADAVYGITGAPLYDGKPQERWKL